jgi:hypothetical protein
MPTACHTYDTPRIAQFNNFPEYDGPATISSASFDSDSMIASQKRWFLLRFDVILQRVQKVTYHTIAVDDNNFRDMPRDRYAIIPESIPSVDDILD